MCGNAFCGKAYGWLVAVCIIACSLPAQAQSNTVTVDGNSYDVMVFGGQSFDANASTLRSAPWWGNFVLALDYANAYSDQVGVQNSTSGVDAVYFAFADNTFDAGGQPRISSMSVDQTGARANLTYSTPGDSISSVSFASAALVSNASGVPEINAGSLSQAVFILLALWLGFRRRTKSQCA